MKHRKKWKPIGALAALGLAGIALWMHTSPVQAEENQDTIYDGIYLDSVDAGGLTPEQATSQYEDYLTKLQGASIEFQLEDETCVINMAELNIQADVEAAVEEASAYGRSGNLLKRYKEITDISRDNKVISVEVEFDEEYLVNMLDSELSDYIVPAQNAGLEYKDGQLVLVEAKSGKELNTEETIGKVEEIIRTWDGAETLQVEVATNELQPAHTSEELAEVTDVIGTFETYYSRGDVSRNNNIANAASKISGSVVYPGEEFDTMSHLVPFTTANGWSYAGAYLNGEVISDIGGGICQVSTTLYNAVLKAELEVTERHPHSMAVGYVQLSADAALNEGTKNFCFVNNTDHPIFIYAYASGGTMHVSIYGKEYRSEGRTVEYKNEILEVIPAGDPIETVDEAQPPEYREVTQTAHTGYRAKLWKYIYENGELVDTVLANSSSYNASPERVTIGKPADPAATEEPATTVDPNAPADAGTTTDPNAPTDTTATDPNAATEAPSTEPVPETSAPSPETEPSTVNVTPTL